MLAETQELSVQEVVPQTFSKYMEPFAQTLASINQQNHKLKAFLDYHYQKICRPSLSFLEIYQKAYDLEMKGLLLFDIAQGQKSKKKLVLKFRVLDPAVIKDYASADICWKNISIIFQTIDKTLKKELEFAFMDFDTYGDASISENLGSRFPLFVRFSLTSESHSRPTRSDGHMWPHQGHT